jgi:hypothetical protein
LSDMKRYALALIAILSTAQAMAQADRRLVVQLSQPAKTFTLNVNISRAAITVSGYNGAAVVIQTDSQDATVQEKSNEVTVDAPARKAIRLNIQVPRTSGIFKLSSVNGGTIMVSDVKGNLELQNKSGGISALNISGSVIAGTLSGRITVSFKKVDPTAPMAFSTISGPVDLTFPADLQANLKLKSDNSKVFSEFDLVADPAHPKPIRDEKDGAYHLAIDDWIYGRVGGGGPEFLIKNTTGNIHIYKTK